VEPRGRFCAPYFYSAALPAGITLGAPFPLHAAACEHDALPTRMRRRAGYRRRPLSGNALIVPSNFSSAFIFNGPSAVAAPPEKR